MNQINSTSLTFCLIPRRPTRIPHYTGLQGQLWYDTLGKTLQTTAPILLQPLTAQIMETSVVYSLIERLNRGDTQSVEQELESYRVSNINGLVVALVNVLSEQQQGSSDNETAVVGIMQSALLILKNIVPKSWSIGFEEFQGPPVSAEIKDHVRSSLMGLLSFEKSKVRSVAASLIAKIASVDYPDEWPVLIDQLLELIQTGNTAQLYGSLSAIKELVAETLSDIEFVRVGETILNAMYAIASSPQEPYLPGSTTRSGTGKYSPHASAMAIEVVRLCVDFFMIAEDTKSQHVATVAAPIIDKWVPLFVQYVGLPVEPSDAGYIDLKLESLKCYKTLFTALPRISSKHALDLFEATLRNIFYNLPTYESIYVHESDDAPGEPVVDPAEANTVFIHPGLTIDKLVYEQLDFMDMATELKVVVTKISTFVPDFVDLLLRLGQIPKNQQSWEDDMDEFALEESELSVGRLIRSQVADILVIAGKSRLFSLLPVLWERVTALANTYGDWKIKESGLYIYSRVLAEGTADTAPLPPSAITEFVKFVTDCQRDGNSLLRSRAYLAAASVCRSLTSRIDTRSLKIPLFEATVDAALNDSNDTVRLACVMSIRKYCVELPKDYFVTKEAALYQAIYLISEKAQEETPAILAEVLVAVVERDLSHAARNPDLVKLIYKLVSQDPTNVMLTNEIQDVMAEIAETATEENVYDNFIDSAMEPLVSSIMSIQDWEYTPELVLSLNILSVLVDKAPYPMPERIITTFFDPLYQITMNSSDNQVLQAASEILGYFTQHAPDQIKNWSSKDGRNGIEQLIMAVARLLDPAWLDSACVNTGILILAIVQNFGDLLGDLLPQMLDATTKRLATAKSPALIENFIVVFSKLVSANAKGVLDILANISVDNETGLSIVLKKWLSNFDILRGYEEIKDNVTSLANLYQLNDSRISAVIVEGDPLPVPKNVILTRSKAKKMGETFTRISAPSKIIKLFLQELIVGQYNLEEAARASAQAANGEGDDWEDLEEEVKPLEGTMPLESLLKYVNRGDIEDLDGEELYNDNGFPNKKWAGSDNATQNLIVNFLKTTITGDVTGFQQNIWKDLNGEEKEFVEKLMKQ